MLRILRANGLTLAPQTARWPGRTHDGIVVALRSNVRWCSDHLELRCRDGAVVRVLFAIDACDREIMAWSATTTGVSAEMVCDPMTRELQTKISRAHDQLLVFLTYPGKVEPANNGSERLLRPAVVLRKVIKGCCAVWAAEGEAANRTVVDTARLSGANPVGSILKTIGA